MILTTALLALLVWLAPGQALDPAPATVEARIEAGHALAQARCSACHAIGPTGASPHPDAPPMREFHQRYPVESLEEALGEGILVGHPDMPEFTLEAGEIADLIAWLKSLEPAEPAS